MIRLISARERRDVDLGFGVTVTVKPVTTSVHRAAQHSAERRARELAYEGGLIEAAGGSIHDIPDLHHRDGMRGLRDQFLLQALARHAIIGWQGVGDEAGAPLPLTPEAIDALIRDHPLIAERFEARVSPRLTELVRRGKRIRRRADWHFGGGAGYCGNVPSQASPAPTVDRAATDGSAPMTNTLR